MEKTCTKCLKTKDLELFSKNKSGKDGRRSICKLCNNAYFREYLGKNPKHIARVNANNQKIKDDISLLKIETGCEICGYKKCARSLHFHHKNPNEKTFGIAKNTRNYQNKEKIKAEINKCIVVCANCHGEIEEQKYLKSLENKE